MKKYTIYKITNLINQKMYIGKNTNKDPFKRWKDHLKVTKLGAERAGKRRYQYLHRAMNKYGVENFAVEIIDECDENEKLNELESFYIQKFNTRAPNGYNLTDGGDGPIGFKFSPEQKKLLNQKYKTKYIGSGNPFFGKKHSEETKKIISEKAKERYKTKPNPFLGKKHSPETIKKLSEINKLNPVKKPFATKEQVELIRARYKPLVVTQKMLSKEFGLSLSVIERIIRKIKPYNF